MISKRHIDQELDGAKEVFNNKESTMEQKIYAIYRVVQASLKAIGSNRVNTVRIMEKLGIPRITSEYKPVDDNGTNGNSVKDIKGE